MTDAHKRELARTMTSLANLKGGWLIIGVKDTGELERCNFSGKLDESASKINNMNNDRCSPPVILSSQRLKCSEGDVIVLKIARRKGIPHAVVKRLEDRIRQREYYLRGTKGKQLVSDFTLQQMFQSVDFPEILRHFSTSLTYSRKGPRLVAPFEIPSYPGDMGFVSFFDSLSESMHKRLMSQEADSYPLLLAELFPYCILMLLGEMYSSSWIVKTRSLGMVTLTTPLPSESTILSAQDLPSPDTGSLLADIGLDPLGALPQRFAIALPRESRISIPPYRDRMSMASSELIISKEDCYRYKFTYRGSSWNRGGPSDHPRSAELGEILSSRDLVKGWGDVSTIRGELSIQCDVDICAEEHEVESYYNWLVHSSDYLESILSWSRFLGLLPGRKLYAIHGDVKRTLDILEDLRKQAL
jgi:hypothetical protein